MCIVIVMYYSMSKYMPIPLAALSKASVCRCSLAGTAGSNTAGVHGCLSVVRVLCCKVQVFASG